MTVVDVVGVKPNVQTSEGLPVASTTLAVSANWLLGLPVITMIGTLGLRFLASSTSSTMNIQSLLMI